MCDLLLVWSLDIVSLATVIICISNVCMSNIITDYDKAFCHGSSWLCALHGCLNVKWCHNFLLFASNVKSSTWLSGTFLRSLGKEATYFMTLLCHIFSSGLMHLPSADVNTITYCKVWVNSSFVLSVLSFEQISLERTNPGDFLVHNMDYSSINLTPFRSQQKSTFAGG